MGGKKKTKWRKLPLEEFTKEIPPKKEEQPSTDTCRSDATREENDFIPSYNGPHEIIQNYVEPYEYIDGIWYPTSCVVYNPPLISNYMMPADTCYYYCTMPEAGQMQEYMPVTYQDYTPALPKDTVYLLLPTQTIRPAQPVQNVAPEWQTRRRRRRYEGYAEYAVIPEKTSSSKTEEKDHSRASGTHTNSRRKSAQFNNFRRMSSLSETSSSDGYTLEQTQISRKSSETKKNPTSTENVKGPGVNKGMGLLSSENGSISKKNPEMCGVHSKRKVNTNEHQIENERTNNISFNDELQQAAALLNTNMENCFNQLDDPLAMRIASENANEDNKKVYFNAMDNKSYTKEVSEQSKNMITSNQETETNAKASSLKQNDHLFQETAMINESKKKDTLKTDSHTSLPDIVSSLNKTTEEKLQQPVNSCENYLCDSTSLYKEINPKPKSSTPQTNNIQSLFSSEALHNEMEMELRQLQSLKASQANQSIYKLAYDENVTDQSSNSRSPSPILSPEHHIPRSLNHSHDEIIVHEADSDDDAGSEDVEMIPHRYESESYLNQQQNKNLYVNKLSLAVELLRTQENLPYDDEFKRIVGENNVEPSVHNSGKVNLGFKRDSCSPERFNLPDNIQDDRHYNTHSRNGITSQRQINPSPDHSSDSAIFSDTDFNNFENESCESAKDIVSQSSENQDNTEEVRAGYRRIGIVHRQFSPLPFNPCFCCIIM